MCFHEAVWAVTSFVRHLAVRDGEDPDVAFTSYPFLSGYVQEGLPYTPDDLKWEEGMAWWQGQIQQWEMQPATRGLPLSRLTSLSGITSTHRLTLILAGLVEEDARFGTLFASLQAPVNARRPTLEGVGRIATLAHPDVDGRTVVRDLIDARLLLVADSSAPRSEWVLQVPSLIWDAVRGVDGSLPNDLHRKPAKDLPDLDDLVVSDDVRKRLRRMPALLQDGTTRVLVVRGTPGSIRLDALRSVAKSAGKGVLHLTSRDAAGTLPPGLGPFCALYDVLPIYEVDPTPGETVQLPPLPGYDGPVGVAIGFTGGLRGALADASVSVELPALTGAERRTHWSRALDVEGADTPDGDALDRLVRSFHLPGRHLQRAARLAVREARLDGRSGVTVGDVRTACRSLGTQLLDTLADRIDTHGSWDQLVVGDAARRGLAGLEQRCRHREDLLQHLGPAFHGNVTSGVRALFTGPSGTGKTLAARILASELGMDLYRVDLAAIINKYIGETEKNLHRVLSTAEELDVILLLDEGDALLGRRTDVRSSNDRYANVETNYLLQRLEHYRGIVLVTTNLGDNIDRAFQRRMDLVVEFAPPEAAERLRIWDIHLPDAALVSTAHLRHLSTRCVLTGGQIRNAALRATLLALDDETPVSNAHLTEAVQAEYRKSGALCPLDASSADADAPESSLSSFMQRDAG